MVVSSIRKKIASFCKKRPKLKASKHWSQLIPLYLISMYTWWASVVCFKEKFPSQERAIEKREDEHVKTHMHIQYNSILPDREFAHKIAIPFDGYLQNLLSIHPTLSLPFLYFFASLLLPPRIAKKCAAKLFLLAKRVWKIKLAFVEHAKCLYESSSGFSFYDPSSPSSSLCHECAA